MPKEAVESGRYVSFPYVIEVDFMPVMLVVSLINLPIHMFLSSRYGR